MFDLLLGLKDVVEVDGVALISETRTGQGPTAEQSVFRVIGQSGATRDTTICADE